jgi:hypothetical protein
MFCPNCATQNLDGASFCRGCGANISLVPQALTGQMVQQPEAVLEEGRRRHRHRRELSLENSFKNFFLGVAFLIIAIALSRTAMGFTWWFWMLLPAFSLMGTGIAQYIRLKEREKQSSLMPPPMTRAFPDQPRSPEKLRSPVTSVTEGTTRHLNANDPKH